MKKWLIMLIIICNIIPIVLIVLGLCLPLRILFQVGIFLEGIIANITILYIIDLAWKKHKNESKTKGHLLKEIFSLFKKDNVNVNDEGDDKRENEIKELNEINTTYGTENQKAVLKRVVSNHKRAKRIISEWPHSYWGRYVAIAFFSCIVLALVFFVVFLVTQYSDFPTVTVALLGVGVVIIFISFIIIMINERKSIWRVKKYLNSNNDKYKRKFIEADAIVKLTIISSYTQTGTKTHSRVSNCVYRILIECNGKKLYAFSRNFYNEGDIVTIIYKEKSTIASIIADYYSEDDENSCVEDDPDNFWVAKDEESNSCLEPNEQSKIQGKMKDK